MLRAPLAMRSISSITCTLCGICSIGMPDLSPKSLALAPVTIMVSDSPLSCAKAIEGMASAKVERLTLSSANRVSGNMFTRRAPYRPAFGGAMN